MLRRLRNWLESFLPRRLPTGMTAFNGLVSDIVKLSGVPENASTRKFVAGVILRTDPNHWFIYIRPLAAQLVKAASNQVADSVLKGTDAPEAKQVPQP